MSAAIIIGELCQYCSKFRSPLDLTHQPGGVTICLDCEQRHLDALNAMATGNFLGQCSECGLNYQGAQQLIVNSQRKRNPVRTGCHRNRN